MSNTEPYTIFCFIPGSKNTFSVKIPERDVVDVLKKAIKTEKPNDLASIDADRLTLHRVTIDANLNRRERIDTLEQSNLNDNTELDDTRQVSNYFDEAPPEGKQYYVVVVIPDAAAPAPLKRKRSVSAPAVSDLVTKRRRVFADPIGDLPPSAFGSSNKLYQLDPGLFVTHRPPRADVVPLELVHPVFGEFLGNAQNSCPNVTDYELVAHLRREIPQKWNNELELCKIFRSILAKYYPEICLSPASVGASRRITDGHIAVNGFMVVVLEAKIVGGQAEVQGGMYTLQARRDELKDVVLLDNPFPFPCIIITLIGTCVGFSGSVLTNRFELGTLTPLFPLHEDSYVGTTRLMPLMRAFGAFRIAVAKLRQEYQGLISPPRTEPPNPDKVAFPYPSSYKNGSGEQVDFKYSKRLCESGLLFLATTSDETRLFIKFTRLYGEDAHRVCSEAGVAPQLHAVMKLPGGWFMVVMDYLDPTTFDHVSGSDADVKVMVCKAVDVLHNRGFVHGDLRGYNMMCRKVSGVWEVFLLDFDWSGKQGEVRYPGDINRITVSRPAEVQGLDLILKEHDRDMIELIF